MNTSTMLIAGGTGFIGRLLTQYFTQAGYKVWVLTRKPMLPNEHYWDGKTMAGGWPGLLQQSDVLINLAGKSVNCRYTEVNKKAILQSRLESTWVLHQAMQSVEKRPGLWLNASSATIYDHSQTHLNTETNGIIGSDFSMDVVKALEEAFFRIPVAGVHQAALRISIVMGNEGGAFPEYKAITKRLLGGPQGSGAQWVSWIHHTDLCSAINHLINHPNPSGVWNITAPQPIRNKPFMEELRKNTGMPFGLPAPAALLHLAAALLGTETELLLKSRYVYPERLLQSGFEFTYPSWQAACRQLIAG